MSRCNACPVPSGFACYGERHRRACELVAEGQPGRAEWLVAEATGSPMPADAGRVDVRIAMLAETCPFGAGPCGCGTGPPRLCSREDRPAEVRRPFCLSCVAVAAWEAQSETPS
jgi:hypothetical protein